MREKYKIGNAQTIGSYQVQSNYFSTKNGNAAFAVLADGTINHINGRRCAVLAVELCMREYAKNPCILKEDFFFRQIADKILKEMRENIYRGKTPYLSLSILAIENQMLSYYTVGRNQLFLLAGEDYEILDGMEGSRIFVSGVTAGIISSGVCEALNEKEQIAFLSKRTKPMDKASQIIQGVIDKHRKKAGNATVLLVEDAL